MPNSGCSAIRCAVDFLGTPLGLTRIVYGRAITGLLGAVLLTATAACEEPAVTPPKLPPIAGGRTEPVVDMKAERAKLGKMFRKRMTMRMELVADPEKQNDQEWMRRWTRLKASCDGLLKILSKSNHAREQTLMIEIMRKYVPETYEEFMEHNRPGYEATAFACLRHIWGLQYYFRNSDLDQNNENDYWVADLGGLHRMLVPNGRPDGLGVLADKEMVRADTRLSVPLTQEGRFGASNDPGSRVMVAMEEEEHRCGYYFAALEEFEESTGRWVAYDDGSGRNKDRYGFCAYPWSYGVSGVNSFIVSEKTMDVYMKDIGGKRPSRFPLDPEKDGWKKLTLRGKVEAPAPPSPGRTPED